MFHCADTHENDSPYNSVQIKNMPTKERRQKEKRGHFMRKMMNSTRINLGDKKLKKLLIVYILMIN